MADSVEEVVTGVSQSCGDVFKRVRVALRPDPALRRVAVGRILGENAFALYLGRGIKVDLVARQRGDCRAGLEGGAGGICTH